MTVEELTDPVDMRPRSAVTIDNEPFGWKSTIPFSLSFFSAIDTLALDTSSLLATSTDLTNPNSFCNCSIAQIYFFSESDNCIVRGDSIAISSWLERMASSTSFNR